MTPEQWATEVSRIVADYIRQDRQWKREHRIAHAKLCRSRCIEAEVDMWDAILEANGAKRDDISDSPCFNGYFLDEADGYES